MTTFALGDIAELRAGVGFPPGLQGRVTGDYPFAKVRDISRAGRSGSNILSTADHYVDQEDLAVLKGKPVPQGSILFAKIGEAIRQNHRVIAGRDLLIDNNAMAAIPKPEMVDTGFLFRYLQTVDFYSLASATTVPALRKSVLERLQVPLPPLDEQRRIAALLDQADALRANRRSVLDHFDELASAVYEAMFGPREWPTMRLVDLCAASEDIRCGPFGTQLQRSEFRGAGVPLWGIKNVNANFLLPAFDFLDPLTAKRLASYSLLPGDIVMTRKGTVGNCAVYPAQFPPGVMHSDLLRLRIDARQALSTFISYQLNTSQEVTAQLKLVSSGAIMPGINVTKLKELHVRVPPVALQEQYVAWLAGLRLVSEGAQRQLTQLDELVASVTAGALASGA